MSREIFHIIPEQFPEFIRDSENYTKFIEFIEDYYKFNQLTDINSERDIDSTNYLDYYFNELARNFSELKSLTEKQQRVVLQKLSDLYKSKGSPDAYKSLFNILFQITPELYYPSRDLFKPSAAKWNRIVSVRFNVLSGQVIDTENVECKIEASGRTYKLNISNISKITDTIYEASFDIRIKLIILNGGKISTNQFVGSLQQSITNYEVRVPGTGFSIGDIFTINNGIGSGTKVRVKKVITDGGIKHLEIFGFGINYINSFFHSLTPDRRVVPNEQNNFSIVVTGTQPITADYPTDNSIENIVDRLVGNKFDYTEISSTIRTNDYFEDNTYVGDQVFESTELSINQENNNEDVSIIFFKLGYVLEYPGYYTNNIGFPDNFSYIQDSFYYQKYSYLVKSIKQFDDYKKPMFEILHPAGLKAFGEYRIANNLSILINVRNALNRLIINPIDEVTVFDQLVLTQIKLLEDNVNLLENVSKQLSKTFSDSASISDSTQLIITKQFNDSVTILDNVALEITQAREANEDLFISEIFSKAITTNLVDIVGAINDVIRLIILKNFTDNVTINDITQFNLTKRLNDSASINDITSKVLTRTVNPEIVNVNDTQFKTNTKTISENLTVSDISAISYRKIINELISTSDLVTRSQIKNIQEIALINDINVKVIVKNLQDSVSILESVNITKNGSNIVSDSYNVVDILNIIYSKRLNENISVSNSGIVVLNPYYDPFGPIYWAAGYYDNEREIT